MEKGISPDSTRQIQKKRIINIAAGDIVSLKDDSHQNQWPLVKVDIYADAKNDVTSVTLLVTDKKDSPSQILRNPITKLVLLAENGFNSPTDGAKTNWTK